MKIAVFAAVGFLAGLGAGTVTKALQVRRAVLEEAAREAPSGSGAAKRKPEQDHGGEDGQGAADPHLGGAPGGGGGVHGDSLLSGLPQSGPGREINSQEPERPSQPIHFGGVVASGTGSLADTAPTPGPALDGPARLAKIFSTMEAKDAAAVLSKLEDDEVRAILAHMSTRKAAEVLGAFPPDRAAALSRSLLVARSGREP